MSAAAEGLVAVLDADVLQDHPDIDPQHLDYTTVAAGAHVVVTANTAHFRSPRFVNSGQIRVQAPAAFLAAVLDEHHELMTAVLAHLAENRRGVGIVADVLDQLDRNHALRPFCRTGSRPAAVATARHRRSRPRSQLVFGEGNSLHESSIGTHQCITRFTRAGTAGRADRQEDPRRPRDTPQQVQAAHPAHTGRGRPGRHPQQPGHAVDYYLNQTRRGLADYYLPERAGAGDGAARLSAPGSSWWGSGAEALDLSGGVERAEFVPLYAKGVRPGGGYLGRRFRLPEEAAAAKVDALRAVAEITDPYERWMAKHEIRRRGGHASVAAWDCTFSPPKSVSLLWAAGDPHVQQQVWAAHLAAVDAGLGYLEEHAAYVRAGRNGVRVLDTSGLVVARMNEWTSREGDMHLHTHCLVLNRAQTVVDGRWRALDGRALLSARTGGARCTTAPWKPSSPDGSASPGATAPTTCGNCKAWTTS